jgi:putative redox protein
MVRIDVAYEGHLHTRCQHLPSGAVLATDAPVDNQGLGESFSPTDLAATALASCMLTVMGIVAEQHGWKLEGSQGQVEKTMVSAPARRIGRLAIRLAMAPGVPADARSVLERAAHSCPVMQSLHPDIDVALEFDWPA